MHLLFGALLGFTLSRILKFTFTKKQFSEAPVQGRFQGQTLAQQLFDEVRIACLILTHPAVHETKARHVLNTWGKRCNKLVFLSTEGASKNDTLGVVELPVEQGRKNLWKKAKEMLKYAYYNLQDEADWFYKADDDT